MMDKTQMELLIKKKERVHLINTLTKERAAFDGGTGSWAGAIPGEGNRMV